LSPAQLRAARLARLGPLLRECADQLGVPSRATFTLKLTDDRELQALNARFLGETQPTDVLAFPGDETRSRQGIGARSRVGDVAISVERALAQSADGPSELRMLAVHGLLHCLGHDHGDPASAGKMTAQTRALLPTQDIPDL
jgi:probable rRNA maturation factor